jgi:Probable cobalt transporter subunit (CbtB)
MMEKILGRSYRPVLPLWSLLALALLLLALFVLLSASGDLLVPLLGRAAGPFDYLHEFAHDGRHLLGVPCH